ncbi:MAG: DUF983 domain-containing protein [Saprospiraceae bacterium]
MSMISSTIHMTCPKCREGKMFTTPFQLKKPLQMYKRCEVCGQKFEPETGFYYGAMFISYLFIALLSFIVVSINIFVLGIQVELSFGILLAFLALIYIWNLRFTRSLWIHLVIKYEPDYIKLNSSSDLENK